MKKAAIWVQAPMVQRADKSEPPHLPPMLDDRFYHAIGKLIAQWAVMELHLNNLVWAILRFNNTHEPGWKTRPFGKRHELLRSEWMKFSKGHPSLSKFLDIAYKDVRTGRVLRDSISHKEIVLGMNLDGNHFIQFYNKTRAKQKSKPYYVADFISATQAAARAAGQFYWVTDPDSEWPLPSLDKQRLHSLPNTDHLRLPT